MSDLSHRKGLYFDIDRVGIAKREPQALLSLRGVLFFEEAHDSFLPACLSRPVERMRRRTAVIVPLLTQFKNRLTHGNGVLVHMRHQRTADCERRKREQGVLQTEICGEPPDKKNGGKKHDKQTIQIGKIRGLQNGIAGLCATQALLPDR